MLHAKYQYFQSVVHEKIFEDLTKFSIQPGELIKTGMQQI